MAQNTGLNPDLAAIVVFDIDGVIRDVGGSYRLALADTVEQFTGQYRPTPAEIDSLKAEGLWNNDWEASQELIYRYFEGQGQSRAELQQGKFSYPEIVAFFQSRYRGPDPDNLDHWTGYICQEPLLVTLDYFAALTEADLAWGFFSGATRGSASYVLERRLGLEAPVLVAMEDAPGKPDPTGLLLTVAQLEASGAAPAAPGIYAPVIYVGDTVADLQTVQRAKLLQPQRQWIGVGVLPPHAQQSESYAQAYTLNLKRVEASLVLSNVMQLNGEQIHQLLADMRLA
ncbi:MAG: TIGR01548 family HAD-type hydrolase [Elainella sp.]